MFEKVKDKFKKSFEKRNVAVFVDGPNILRKELGVSLTDVKREVSKFGNLKIAKVFLNQFASNKLMEAVANEGFEPVITVGDVDVAMTADAVEVIFNPSIDIIAIVTRDSDFLPAVVKAKRSGKATVVLMAEESSAAALRNTADHVVIFKK